MPTIDLTDAELAAVTAAIRRAIEEDRFPHAPRLDPLRSGPGAKLEGEAAAAQRAADQRQASAAIIGPCDYGPASMTASTPSSHFFGSGLSPISVTNSCPGLAERSMPSSS